MKPDPRRLRPIPLAVLLLAVLPCAPAVRAQDEPKAPQELEAPEPAAVAEEAEAPEAAPSAWTILLEAEVWVAQPSGMEYQPATELNPDSPFETQLLTVTHGTEDEGRYALAMTLPNGWGTFLGSYLTQEDNADLSRSEPGQPIFGEIATHPLYAGFLNDQIADRFDAETRTRLTDWRIALSRPAFRTPRVRGDWSVGWRRVKHIRDMSVVYRTTLADLPPLIPPVVQCGAGGCPILRAGADQAAINSTFEGRGLEGGFDVDFDLWQDKLVVESGVHLAVLRGDITADYLAQNEAFVCTANKGVCTEGAVINPPYDIFDDPVGTAQEPEVLGESVEPTAVPIGLESDSADTTSEVLDGYIALRWKALSWLEVYAGFRQTRYEDVGIDLRPKGTSVSPSDIGEPVTGFQDVDEISRSLTYEGFYGGLAFRVK